jgi:ADP-ribose pyrophosphatase YjhB (NUDIX family)
MNEYYQNLPQKRMGSGALFFDNNKEGGQALGRLLIVKPTYRDNWLIPGGVVEEKESPLDCCFREVKEELGLNIAKDNFRLLAIDYMHISAERPESLQFIFYGGVLNQEQIDRMIVPKKELSEYKFVEINQISAYFVERLWKRVRKAIKNIGKNAVYLENGE